MTKKPRRTGKPKALEAEDERAEQFQQTPEEFAQELFGQADIPQNGMLPIDEVKEQFQTKSAAIRWFINQGYSVRDISKHLGLRYQHVRNVATSTLKRGPNEDWRRPDLKPKQN